MIESDQAMWEGCGYVDGPTELERHQAYVAAREANGEGPSEITTEELKYIIGLIDPFFRDE